MSIQGSFNSERGSFAVAGAFFMIVFLMIAGLGVDVANYFNRKSKVQNIADGAALAGANAMNQHADTPARSKAYNAALSYIKANQGDSFVDLYEPETSEISDDDKIILHGPLVDSDGDTFYKFGVIGLGDFEPYFLPRQIFGGRNDFVQSKAVARVEGKVQDRRDTEPIDCGVYADDKIDLDGLAGTNGQNIDAGGANFCGNADVEASNVNSLGDIHQLSGSNHDPPSGWSGDRNTFDSPKEMPSFKDDSPSDYETIISDDTYDNDFNTGGCSAGPLSGKAIDGLEWSNSGDDVCVERTVIAGDTEFEIVGATGNPGQIQDESGDPASIYADDDLKMTDNGIEVNGGIYVDGDFSASGNNNKFYGDKNTNGGLAIWAVESIDISKNSSEVEGILGTTNGDIDYSHTGGGNSGTIKGVVSAGGNFNMPANSNNALIDHDTSMYDEDYLDIADWYVDVQTKVEQPYFANVSVRLIE